MALITGRNFDGGTPISESEWTLALIAAGNAEWGESDQRQRGAPAVSQTPAAPPSEGLYARTRGEQRPKVSQTRKRKPGGKTPKTELVKVRVTPEEKRELELMTSDTTVSRFIRKLIRDAQHEERS